MNALKTKLLLLIFLLTLANQASLLPRRAQAAPSALTLTVNTTLADAVDVNPGDGICETAPGNNACTLRAAVMEANANPGVDTILIPAGTYTLTRPSNGPEEYALDGDLDLTDSVIITGAGAVATIIDGNRTVTQARLLQIFSGVHAHISHLTLRNGTTELVSGISGNAGGILNLGNLTLEAVQLLAHEGGGLHNQGVAQLDAVTYANNSGEFAALSNNSGGTLTIGNSVINHNMSSGFSNGGGLSVGNGLITIINSTITDNQTPGSGGGIYIYQSVPAYPTTLRLYNVTLVDNIADTDQNNSGDGGGIFIATSSGYVPEVHISNTIVAGNRLRFFTNPVSSDCAGSIHSGGYNLIGSLNDCSVTGVTTGNLTGLNPLLSNLLENGGPTRTRLPLSFSPVVDAANPAGCAADDLGGTLTADQRGYARHVDGGSGAARCDMGASEYNAGPPEPPPPDPSYSIYLPLLRH